MLTPDSAPHTCAFLTLKQVLAIALPQRQIASCRDTQRPPMLAVPVAMLCVRDAHRIFSVEQLTPCHTSSLVVTNPGTISTCHVHGQVLYPTLCIIPPTISMYTDVACWFCPIYHYI